MKGKDLNLFEKCGPLTFDNIQHVFTIQVVGQYYNTNQAGWLWYRLGYEPLNWQHTSLVEFDPPTIVVVPATLTIQPRYTINWNKISNIYSKSLTVYLNLNKD